MLAKYRNILKVQKTKENLFNCSVLLFMAKVFKMDEPSESITLFASFITFIKLSFLKFEIYYITLYDPKLPNDHQALSPTLA